MIVAMLLFAALGEWVLVPSSAVRAMDEGGVTRAADLLADHPGLHDPAVLWAGLSGPWLVHPFLLLITLLLLARGRVAPRALLVVVVGVIGWYLGTLCKQIVARPRPTDAVVELSSWSYPSGHATNIALGAVLLIALVSTVRAAWIRWAATALALLGVALTAADRLVLGVHYPSDVLAGLALGTVMGLLGLAILRPLAPPRDLEGRQMRWWRARAKQ